LYFSQASRHGDFIVISSELGTRQGDTLGGMLFVLVHFHALRLIVATHPICVFPFLTDDTHIVGPTLNVVLAFLRLQEELLVMGFSVQPTKCVSWFP